MIKLNEQVKAICKSNHSKCGHTCPLRELCVKPIKMNQASIDENKKALNSLALEVLNEQA